MRSLWQAEQRRGQGHRRRTVRDDHSHVGQREIVQRGTRPLCDFRAGFPAPTAHVTAGHPIGVLVRKTSGDLVPGQALSVTKGPLAKTSVGFYLQTGDFADRRPVARPELRRRTRAPRTKAATRPATSWPVPDPYRPAEGRPAPGNGARHSTSFGRAEAAAPAAVSSSTALGGRCAGSVERDRRTVPPQPLQVIEDPFFGVLDVHDDLGVVEQDPPPFPTSLAP